VKNFIKVSMLAAGIIFFVNTNSYALVDASVYGGYAFTGKMDLETPGENNPKVKGYDIGAKGHVNFSILPLLELGIGGYYQNDMLSFDYSGYTWKPVINSIGFDGNIILALPIIHPYIRVKYSILDHVSLPSPAAGFDASSETKYFQGYGAGAGVELTFIPFFRIFGEYVYDYSKFADTKITRQKVNVGLKFDF